MHPSLRLFLLTGVLALPFESLCHADAVRLQINGPDGKPVAGAKVRIVESKGQWFHRNLFAPRDLVSDANGQIALESKQPLGDKANDYAEIVLQARVVAPGLMVSGMRLKAGDNTLALVSTPDGPLEGVALGDDQKPIAGAHLLLTLLHPSADKYVSLPDELALVATTDAQGHWQFEGVPNAGEVAIEVRDDRFKRESFRLDLSQKTPPLFLTPGATIKGRLLTPDGKGAAGVKILGGDFTRQVVTDANGRFALSGLSDNNMYLQTVTEEHPLAFLVPGRTVQDLKLGAVRDIGDWKTLKGISLKGRLVDSATKKPVEDAQVQTWGDRISSNARSDKTGAFQMFVSDSSSGLSVYAADYANLSAKDIPAPKNGAIDMGTLALTKGPQIKGILLDEDGNAVTGTQLFALDRNGNRNYARSDSQSGAFSFGVLDAGDYTINMDGYEIFSGAAFRVGPKGVPPLRVVVKGKAEKSATTKFQTIEGRVLDAGGNPVAGAKIAFQLKTKGGTYTTATALSQSDGTFVTSSHLLHATLTIANIDRPGFVRGPEKIEAQDGGFRVSLNLQQRGAALRGRVVNAAGQPVAGAYVGLESGDTQPVVTGADGTFALPDVPLTGVPLMASDGPSLARFTPEKAGAPIEIALPAVDPEDNAALAEQALSKGSLGYDWQDEWNALGPKRIEALIVRQHANQAGNDWTWKKYLLELARQEPQTLLTREAELRALTAPETIPEFDRLTMLVRASSSDGAGREKARAWLGAQEGEKREFNEGSLTRLLGLAQVGFALDKQTGQQWLDYAGQIATQLGGGNVGEKAWDWGALAARVSPDAPEILAEDWSSTAQIQLLVAAMQRWRKDGNLAAAQQGWKTLQPLAVDAAQHPDPQVKIEGFVQKPADLLLQAQGDYVRLLAQTDATAALALTGSLPEWGKVEALQDIANAAVEKKQFDIARQAIRAVLEVGIGNPEFAASAVATAQKFDPQLAAELWPTAYAKARPREANMGGGRSYRPSIAAYAGARAKTWPGESRILIEREWTWRLAHDASPPTADTDFDSNGEAMQALATAMASLSPRRALEMAEQVPQKNELRARTNTAIAVVLLTP